LFQRRPLALHGAVTREEAILRAREAVRQRYGGAGDRQWLVAVLDSYDDPCNRIEFHVLEGSPPKGWVVVDQGTAIAYDQSGRRIKAWHCQSYGG
jgi:hypothetical protein